MRNKIIFSAEYYELSKAENAVRTSQAINALKALDLDFKVIEGSYKGISEISFCVDNNDIYAMTLIKRLAFGLFNQHSILVVNNSGKGSLVYEQGSIEGIPGIMTEVSENEASTCEAYSNIEGKYYVIK